MSINIVEAIVTANKCYQIGAALYPQGIMLHSVGCAQPSAAVFARSFNQYQPGGASVCVHAFVQADGAVYQTMPWETIAWHCGGSANSTHIGVEMTEPSAGMTYAEAAEQIAGTYHTAVELFAALCKQYGLDPLADGVIIGHAEGHRRGVASNHADPELLWRTYDMGYTMDGFRRDVAAKMAAGNTDEEDDMVRYDSIDDVPGWARGTVKEMMDAGLISGTGGGNLGLSDDMLRMLYIMWHMRDTRYGRIVDGKVMDVPAWAQDTVQKLVDDGVLAGVGDGKLDLSMDMLRTLVIAANMDK
nr:MAG TPA: PGRP protein [Caudoviricetes sp.]